MNTFVKNRIFETLHLALIKIQKLVGGNNKNMVVSEIPH